MKNDLFVPVGRLLQFEFRRFKGRSRLALLFILIIPLLYGGIYLHANWDLYNHLDRVPIAVVNHDKPVKVNGEVVSGGRDFEDALRENPTLGWKFLGENERAANAGLADGKYYAVIVVPEDFSAKITSASTYEATRASLVLHRDDANGFIIGLLTGNADAALTKSLDESVSRTYFKTLFTDLGTIKDSLTEASDGSKQLDDGLAQARDGVHTMNTRVADALRSSAGIKGATDQLSAGLDSADKATQQLMAASARARRGTSKIMSASQAALNDLQNITSASDAILAFIKDKLPTLQKDAKDLVAIHATLQNPNGDSVVAISRHWNASGQKLSELLAAHPELADDASYVALSKELQAGSDSTTSVATNLAAAAKLSGGLNLNLNAKDLAGAGNRLQTATGKARDTFAKLSSGLDDINAALNTADGAMSDLSAAEGNLTSAGRTLLKEGGNALSGVQQLSDGLGRLDTAMPQLASGAHELSTGLADGAQQIPGLSENQRDNLSEIMSQPVQIDQVVDNPATYYGRGLAPMFFSIALWIAGVSTFLVVRTISGRAMTGRSSTPRTTLMGFGPIATVAIVGGLIMGFGVWLALGLNPVHPVLFIGQIIVTALAFMAPAYLLRLIFGSPQTALYLVFLILQLPTCGGTFPVGLLPPVYQNLAIVSPLKYSVDAFRVSISGGNLSIFWGSMTVLAGVAAVSLALTMVLVHRRKKLRMRDLHPPMVTSNSTADYAFSVRPR
ncbi:YhgE/Pip domain-containing protein [Nigerium massiliense]|uniref:YhgE/Pip domain-containing protein n=1 Tax=Nigerium massiliense TaxID=1522317 RepID=UPI000B2CC204|nr:YhgE/Pip domain-containing protein [Nigerium massiliense]